MFEKEAEEYLDTESKYLIEDNEGNIINIAKKVKQAFQDGAEFGYNKAKVEVEESYRESLCNSELNLASVTEQLEELEKANEWHFMKDVNCYEDLPQNEDVYYAYKVNVGAFDKPKIEWKLGCQADFEYDVMAYHVIAWKEIVLPELKE